MTAPTDGRHAPGHQPGTEKLRRGGEDGDLSERAGSAISLTQLAAQPVAADDTSTARAASASSTLIAPDLLVRRRRRIDRDELGDRGRSVNKLERASAAARVAALLGLDDLEDVGEDELLELAAARPKTRRDCLPGGINEARPCPWLACRAHLAIDITAAGSLHVYHNRPLEQLEHTCVLDLAEQAEDTPVEVDVLGRFRNGQFAMTLEEVGVVMNVTRERIRQLEARALLGAAASARYYGLGESDAAFTHPTYGEDDYR